MTVSPAGAPILGGATRHDRSPPFFGVIFLCICARLPRVSFSEVRQRCSVMPWASRSSSLESEENCFQEKESIFKTCFPAARGGILHALLCTAVHRMLLRAKAVHKRTFRRYRILTWVHVLSPEIGAELPPLLNSADNQNGGVYFFPRTQQYQRAHRLFNPLSTAAGS